MLRLPGVGAIREPVSRAKALLLSSVGVAPELLRVVGTLPRVPDSLCVAEDGELLLPVLPKAGI